MQLGPLKGGKGGQPAVDGHVVRRHELRAVAVVEVGLKKLLGSRFVFPRKEAFVSERLQILFSRKVALFLPCFSLHMPKKLKVLDQKISKETGPDLEDLLILLGLDLVFQIMSKID